MADLINIGFVVNAIVFAFLGVIIFWISFLLIDKLTPYHLWKEIVDEQLRFGDCSRRDVAGHLHHHCGGDSRVSLGAWFTHC